jgi:PAS domain S-box-containing protein
MSVVNSTTRDGDVCAYVGGAVAWPGLAGFPRDGVGMDGSDGSAPIERRGNGRPGDSAVDVLRRLPAVAALERLPVPALAMSRNGFILFANAAFAEMVGYERDALVGEPFLEIFDTVPAGEAGRPGVDALTNRVVQLRHCEGWTVRARMSKSALTRRDDPLVLVTFDDLTDRLWGADNLAFAAPF